MKKYILDLTDDLIRRYHLQDCMKRMERNSNIAIRRHIKFDLESNALSPTKMSPKTIGRILGSLGKMDVLLCGKEFFDGVHFSGDPSETFREMAANCLAAIIFYRLSPTADSIKYIPVYIPPNE